MRRRRNIAAAEGAAVNPAVDIPAELAAAAKPGAEAVNPAVDIPAELAAAAKPGVDAAVAAAVVAGAANTAAVDKAKIEPLRNAPSVIGNKRAAHWAAVKAPAARQAAEATVGIQEPA